MTDEGIALESGMSINHSLPLRAFEQESAPDCIKCHCLAMVAVMLLLLTAAPTVAAMTGQSTHHISGVDRVVAVGDLHGDWDGYLATLRAAGLVDERARWAGGTSHLVQTGDIPDRGPDTRRIIEHMARLSRQAERAGGRVHNLMGNHEAMNVYGDLRYVTPGEFAAWSDRRSARLRDRYLDKLLDRMEAEDPATFDALPDNFRAQWMEEHPEGWLEHRYAWSPIWNPNGEMYEWVNALRVAIRIGETIFVHGGISSTYCRSTFSSWTRRAHDALDARSHEALDILVDPLGPLWYRGLSGVEPQASRQVVDAILEHYGAQFIVVGHTPTGGVVWPRYGGRVVQIDTGISEAYGGHIGYLEITPEGRFAGYRNGRVRLPDDLDNVEDLTAYVRSVADLHPANETLIERLSELEAEAIRAAETPSHDAAPQPEPEAINCGSPG